MTTTVHLAFNGNIATLTLANADAHKPATLDEEILESIGTRLEEFETWCRESHASTAPLLLIRSAHERYFVVGADIKALGRLDANSIQRWVETGHRVFQRLEAVPVPTIALVQGYALGGGLELAMACDFIWATPTAIFGQPEATLGMTPGWGGTLRLPRRIGVARAKEMLFSARSIDVQTALSWKLVDRVGEMAELQEQVERFAAEIAACSAAAICETKRIVQATYAEAVDHSLVMEATASARSIADPDTSQRIANFLNRRRK